MWLTTGSESHTSWSDCQWSSGWWVCGPGVGCSWWTQESEVTETPRNLSFPQPGCSPSISQTPCRKSSGKQQHNNVSIHCVNSGVQPRMWYRRIRRISQLIWLLKYSNIIWVRTLLKADDATGIMTSRETERGRRTEREWAANLIHYVPLCFCYVRNPSTMPTPSKPKWEWIDGEREREWEKREKAKKTSRQKPWLSPGTDACSFYAADRCFP